MVASLTVLFIRSAWPFGPGLTGLGQLVFDALLASDAAENVSYASGSGPSGYFDKLATAMALSVSTVRVEQIVKRMGVGIVYFYSTSIR